MKKLHDLKLVLSTEACLTQVDCMKIKGGAGGDDGGENKRIPRPSTSG